MEHEYGGSFSNFSTCEMKYTSAVSACSQYGSHVVFIESQEEEDFILVAGETGEDFWLGLTGTSYGEARWLDGSSLTYINVGFSAFQENAQCFSI